MSVSAYLHISTKLDEAHEETVEISKNITFADKAISSRFEISDLLC